MPELGRRPKAYERGWHILENGDLSSAAEAAGFEASITTEKNLRHQQNLAARRLAILVLSTTDWRRIRRHVDVVAAAVDAMGAGAFVELAIPVV